MWKYWVYEGIALCRHRFASKIRKTSPGRPKSELEIKCVLVSVIYITEHYFILDCWKFHLRATSGNEQERRILWLSPTLIGACPFFFGQKNPCSLKSRCLRPHSQSPPPLQWIKKKDVRSPHVQHRLMRNINDIVRAYLPCAIHKIKTSLARPSTTSASSHMKQLSSAGGCQQNKKNKDYLYFGV